MKKIAIRVMCAFCCLAVAVVAFAQAGMKPGLWSTIATITWQKSPMPPGLKLPPGVEDPFAPSTHTTDVCVTQEMIDKYGAPVNYSQAGESCTVSNIAHKPDGMTADMTCTGRMNAHATIASSWSGGDKSHTTVHFTGTMQMGPNSTPVEYTVESNATYKSADCGNVKPPTMPATK
jgi:hypothetical protein